MIVYVNGKFVPREKAVVSVEDHGFLYGDGIYETIRIFEGKPFLLEGHLKRLAHSARGIQLKLPLSLKAIGDAVTATVRRNGFKEAVLRLTVSRGPGPYGFDPRPCKKPTLVISCWPFQPYPASFYKEGLKLGIVSVRRNSPRSLPPSVKSTNCLNGILAKMESIALGANEGLFLTLDDHLAEGTVSNVFVVKDGRLATPALHGTLLAGVTREWVSRLARQNGLSVREDTLEMGDLLGADEVFLTNTTMNVMPVGTVVWRESGRIEEKRFSVGAVTRTLMDLFDKNHRLFRR